MSTTNTLLTPSIIAREALVALEANMVMHNLVHTDYSQEFVKVGDTITIRKPPVLTASKFTSAVSPQNITDQSTTIVMDEHIDVTINLNPTDLTLKLSSFTDQISAPAMRAIAQYIDTKLCQLYKGIPYYTGAATSTPAALDDIANIVKKMADNKCPLGDAAFVMNPAAQAKLIVLNGIVNVEKSGSPLALREALVGRIYGLDTFMDQNVQEHTAGIPGGSPVASGTAGNFTVAVTAGGSAGTYKEGDLVTFATDSTGQYVVTEDLTLSTAGAGTMKIYPALAGNLTTQVITLVATHKANLAFRRQALAFVNRPLAIPVGLESQGAWVDDPEVGISIRVMYGYDTASKVQTISFDCLCGFKVIYPEMAVRVLG
jgi:hypothetical protein